MSERDLTPSSGREVEERRDHLFPISALQREMDRVFNDFFRDFGRPRLGLERWGEGAVSLRVDVSETDDAYEVEAELPGLDDKDIEVNLSENRLIIRGEKKQEKEEKKKDYIRTERSYGRIERTIPLPAEIEESKVTATFSKGVLKVHLPKAPEAKTKVKKIKVDAK